MGSSNSTIQLQRTLNIVQMFIRNAPLNINAASDPVLNMADWVRNFMLSPPFAWRWNRSTLTIQCVVNQQDYKVNLQNFGWIEQATVIDVNGYIHPLEPKLNLHEETQANLPTQIAPRLDDGNGNITFRIIPTPSQAFIINLSYQNASVTFNSVNQLWNPIPDYLSHVYTQGLLSKAYEYIADDRYPIAMQVFAKQVIAANGGLSEAEAAIFLTDFLNNQRFSQSTIGMVTGGMQGRMMS